ncbi:MAG: glycosyltransferase, partial [Candidatus Electrothrix sp. ATG1]|nr:glycosyltransferase [Candidatus Electrothrix sp. ATG1]
LCRALAERGHTVEVYTTAVDGKENSRVELEKPMDVDGVQVTYFPSSLLRRLFWSPSMQQALEQNICQFDLVHLHTCFVWPVYAAAMAAQQAGVPYLFAPRGMLERGLIRRKSWLKKSLWIQCFGKKILSGAAALQVTTRREAEQIKALNLPVPHLVHIPNGIDPHEVQDGNENGNGVAKRQWGKAGYVLFLSRINWKKGLDRLIYAWGCGLDLPLVIAGNDEEQYTLKLMALAKEQGVGRHIHFIGQVAGAEKWALYKGAKLLVLPSYSENFGNVVLEAMAAGCPVLVTPEVGLADAVTAYGAGVVVEGKPEKLAAAITSLLNDKDALNRMGRQGMRAANEHFSWSAIAQKMETVYLDVLGRDN